MSQKEVVPKRQYFKRKHAFKKSSGDEDEDPLVDEFREELRVVYHQVDKMSNLLWSHDNGLVRSKRREVKRCNRDNYVCEDPYYEKLNKKTQKTDEIQGFNWKTDSTAQIGYGEITKGAMLKFFMILQNIDLMFKPEHEEFMKFKKEEYRLTADDTFIDIGSGFGKPVFHAAMQVGCYSRGIEIVPARVEYCIDFIYEYEAKNKSKIDKEDKRIAQLEQDKSRSSLTPLKAKRERKTATIILCNPLAVDMEEDYDKSINQKGSSTKDNNKNKEKELIEETKEIKKGKSKGDESKIKSVKKVSESKEDESVEDEATDIKVNALDLKLSPNYSILWYRKVTFEQCDAGKLKCLKMPNKDKQRVDISHIYSYNKVMGKDCLKGIGRALSNTNFKILAWYVNEKTTYKIVKNIKLLFKKPMRSTGNEQFSVYVYYKTKENDNSSNEESEGDEEESEDE